jgi:uncharacterized protein YaiI (UPF0178 family)
MMGALSPSREFPMRVWIDADACPKAARDLIVKFALKRKFEVVMVAGQAVAKPAFAIVRLIVVPSGMDAADDYLVEHAVPGELVICSDVPLADRLVKRAWRHWTRVGESSTNATWATAWRRATCSPSCASRARWGGQGAYGEREKQAFANALDRIIAGCPSPEELAVLWERLCRERGALRPFREHRRPRRFRCLLVGQFQHPVHQLVDAPPLR